MAGSDKAVCQIDLFFTFSQNYFYSMALGSAVSVYFELRNVSFLIKIVGTKSS